MKTSQIKTLQVPVNKATGDRHSQCVQMRPQVHKGKGGKWYWQEAAVRKTNKSWNHWNKVQQSGNETCLFLKLLFWSNYWIRKYSVQLQVVIFQHSMRQFENPVHLNKKPQNVPQAIFSQPQPPSKQVVRRIKRQHPKGGEIWRGKSAWEG